MFYTNRVIFKQYLVLIFVKRIEKLKFYDNYYKIVYTYYQSKANIRHFTEVNKGLVRLN